MQISNVAIEIKEFKRAERLMGNSFQITVVADDESWAVQWRRPKIPRPPARRFWAAPSRRPSSPNG